MTQDKSSDLSKNKKSTPMPFSANERLKMEINSIVLHQIDHVGSVIKQLNVAQDNEDFKLYINELLNKITDAENKRQFIFESEDTEVKLLIEKIIKGDDFLKAAEKIADRLMRKEQNAQSDIEHLKHEVQKGILVQALVEIGNKRKLVIAKADHIEYLDDQNLKQRKGLPLKKKLYKALMLEFNKKNEILDIFVYDTNSRIAKYWWSDFLELTELNTDEHNTELAFDAIDNLLGKIKKDYPADHNILRNRSLGYFKSNREFKIEHFIKSAIGNYEAVNSLFKIDAFKTKLLNLPEKLKFDAQFSIKPEIIKAKKLRNIVVLNDKMDLHIKEHIQNWGNVIEAETIKGQKYIRIKTDLGYEAFKK